MLCENGQMNVTVPQSEHNRLEGLLRDPREALDVEIKGWLDLGRNADHKAKLAKALLALENHGGGYVIIGLTETDTGFTTASGQPDTLDAYSQDDVNGIVHNYAEPAFHCSVHYIRHPASRVIHPIISVRQSPEFQNSSNTRRRSDQRDRHRSLTSRPSSMPQVRRRSEAPAYWTRVEQDTICKPHS